ncbi:hypothetical protein EMCRGX_G015319 [Ephydatia muelleri]
MGRSVLAALEVRNLTARKLVADLGTRDLLVRIMIHTSYSGSTYNMQEDISDASVLLNKFNTGDGQGKVWDALRKNFSKSYHDFLTRLDWDLCQVLA